MEPDRLTDQIEIVDVGDLPETGATTALRLLRDLVGDYCREAWNDAASWSFVAVVDGAVAGAAIGLPLDPEDRAYMTRALTGRMQGASPGARAVVEELENDDPAGDMYALAVDPRFRGRGIAVALVEARLRAFAEAGLSLAIAESWVNPADSSSASVYRRMAFEELALVPEYWSSADREAESNERRGCPVCGSHCTCDAILFGRKL